MEINLIDVLNTLQSYGVLISFSGRFSQKIIEELGDAVKKYLETEAISQKETYNVFSVFIEQTQNIKNYSAEKSNTPLKDRIANSGIVAIGKSEAGYFVSSGNLVESADVPLLADRLEAITLKDKADLKKLYKEQIKKEVPPGTTRAGLGLIEMARKASQPLKYSMIKIDEEVYFFNLMVQV